jgi:hypothetical protein
MLCLKRLVYLTIGTLVAAAGAMAPTAGASGPPSGHAVTMTPAHLSISAPEVEMKVGAKSATCRWDLDADLTASGGVNVTGAEMEPGESFCVLMAPVLPWQGQICGKGMGEGTLFLPYSVDTPLGSIAGWTEAPLAGKLAAATGAVLDSEVGSGTGTELFGAMSFGRTISGKERKGTCPE